MAEFIEILSPTALSNLDKATAKVVELVKNIDEVGKKSKVINLPSGVDSFTKDLANKYKEMEANIASLQKKLQLATESNIKNTERQRLSEIKLAQDREKAFDKYEKQLQKEAQAQIRESEKIIKQKEKEFREFEKQFNKYEADLRKKAIEEEKAKKATVQAILDESKAYQSLQRQKEKALKDAEREQAKLEASANLYNKVQAKMNALSNEYKALATRKELFNNLTAKEEQRYTSLQTRIQKYDQTLKAVDASMGKYQRNVGNYASAFNPLGNSINQLTREMPAFANSVQTGFMAISNNLPIFFDSIQEVIRQNKELQAQGQPTKSVLSQLAGSFFSLGTALSVGVTLLTVYGAEVVNFLTGAEKKKKAIEAEKKATEDRNEAEKKVREIYSQNQAQEISRSKILLETARNVSLSYKQRNDAVKELQQRYPDYLGNLSKEKILAGETADAEIKLNDALVKRGIALASQQLIQEEINKQLQNNKKLNDDLNEIQRQRIEAATELNKYDPFGKYDEETLAKIDKLKWKLAQLIEQEKNRRFDTEQNNLVIQDSINFYVKQYNENAKFLDIVKEEEKIKRKKNKTNRDDLETLNLTTKSYDSMLIRLEEAKSQLEEQQKATSRNTQEWAYYEKAIKDVDLAIEILKNGFPSLRESAQGAIKDFEDQAKATEEQKKALEKLNQIMKDYVASFSADFFSRSGFPTLFKALNGEIVGFGKNWKVTFQAIGEIAQETFNFATQMSRDSFQQAFANLQREKEIAIAFAGDSATAREEIERQYQERQRELKRRQAKQERDLAIFNIIIDTAQGVVSALASTPPNVPLSIAIGAIGAAQLAMVAARQIPEFYKGTDNAPEGWAWTQERGREIITDKHGRIKSTGSDGGAKLTYLNKGDKVFDATKSALMFDSALNSMLMDRGVSMPKVEVSNTLNENHVNRIVKAVQSIDTVSLNIDKGGLNAYVGNGHSRKELANMRVRGRGRSV